MRADALARSLYCKDFVSFWKGVRGMNCNNSLLTTKVGDVGSKNVTQLWQDHLSTLLNSVHNIDSKEFVCENIEHGVSDVSLAVGTIEGGTIDKNNYRPIAIVIALSKIYELCIIRMIARSTFGY